MENKKEIPDIDPKKLFDDKNYSTIILNNENADEPIAKNKKKKVGLAKTILALIDSDKADLLKTLKDSSSQGILIDLIINPENKSYLSKLIALCWESGLDFGKHASLFFDLSINEDVFVSLEALTVLEQIENFSSKDDLEKGIELLKKGAKSKHANKNLMGGTRLHLFEKLKSLNA